MAPTAASCSRDDSARVAAPVSKVSRSKSNQVVLSTGREPSWMKASSRPSTPRSGTETLAPPARARSTMAPRPPGAAGITGATTGGGAARARGGGTGMTPPARGTRSAQTVTTVVAMARMKASRPPPGPLVGPSSAWAAPC